MRDILGPLWTKDLGLFNRSVGVECKTPAASIDKPRTHTRETDKTLGAIRCSDFFFFQQVDEGAFTACFLGHAWYAVKVANPCQCRDERESSCQIPVLT